MNTPYAREIIAACFAALLILHLFWCLYVAYPIALDNFIRRGRAWLYLPIRWRGFYKFFVIGFTNLNSLAVPVLGVLTLHLFVPALSPWILGVSAVVFIVVFFFVNHNLLKWRFKQQLDVYFSIRRRIQDQNYEKGQKMSEAEVDNIASFQHQNLLREADRSGKLLKTMNLESSQAKKKR